MIIVESNSVLSSFFNDYYLKILLIFLAYFLGAIPFSVWIGKWVSHIDVREHGSKNAGATNTMRVLGAKVGIPVLILDILKGFLAVKLVTFTNLFCDNPVYYTNFQILLGIIAVLGHIFPIYIGFKGGKGVATILGAVLAIATYPVLLCIAVFVITLLITKYVSVSSLMAGFAFPLLMIFVFKTQQPTMIIFSVAVFLMLVITHQKNIERLLRKEENKVGFLVRKK